MLTGKGEQSEQIPTRQGAVSMRMVYKLVQKDSRQAEAVIKPGRRHDRASSINGDGLYDRSQKPKPENLPADAG